MDAPYPAHHEADVVLRDGSTVRIRPARADDRARVEDYLIGLSSQTRQLRFWSVSIDVSDVAAKAVDVDYRDHFTLLALTGGEEEKVVGGAQYIRMDETRAEMSVSVADEMQARGLGSILIGQIVQAGDENGIPTFVAEVLPENHRMIDVLRKSGFSINIRALPGTIEVEFPTSVTDEALARFDRRETEASIAAMRAFLQPGSVAVVGASRDPESIGGRLFRNLLLGGFHGPVYPVNPKAEVVQGVRAYPSITSLPGPIDVAFIAVPAPEVLEVARECGQAGARGLVVISSGFGESGGSGPARQRDLLEICREFGMRLIGPNCMGIANTDPQIGLNGTFASAAPPPGRVGFLSQSGALGLAVMEYAEGLGLGLSSFVSVGNKADISGNDLVAYWDADEGTDLLLLYLESFGNPRRFARLTREVARRKPIVAVKSGRTAAGARAAGSHTGALLAASDVTVDALFRESGVIRTDTLEEMFDVAVLLAHQPAPRGNRVAIVTNAGGLGILCADTCEAEGLSVPPLSEHTAARLREFLPGEASVANPVDMIASAVAEDYARAITAVAQDPEIDAVIVIYIPPIDTHTQEIASAIAQAGEDLRGKKTILATFMSAEGAPHDLRTASARVPSFAFPERAAIALARAARYGAWVTRPEGHLPVLSDVRSHEAAAVIAGVLKRGGGWLAPEELERLLSCYGLPVIPMASAATADEAGAAAERIGGTVVLKAVGTGLVHKTELGAVELRLSGSADVRRAASDMTERLRAAGVEIGGFVVQPMIEGGVEMLVGVVHDRLFGPVVACSAGGTTAELMHDVAVRVAPLTDLAASEMLRSLSTFPLLDGYRGSTKMDTAALQNLILRVSALADAHGEIAEMDCNPVMVLPTGASIVDARVRVESAPPPAPLGARVVPRAS